MTDWTPAPVSPELDAYIRSTHETVAEMMKPIREALGQLPHKVAAPLIREADEILNVISDRLLGCDDSCGGCEVSIFGVDMENGAAHTEDGVYCASCMKEAREAYLKGVADGTVDPETGEAYADIIDPEAA